MTSLFFHHLTRENKKKTLLEIFRVLKPNGRLHVADWDKPANFLMKLAQQPIIRLDGATTRDSFQGKCRNLSAKPDSQAGRKRRNSTPSPERCACIRRKKDREIMEKSVFEIAKMDCPAEENLVRLKLDGIEEIKNLDFDIPNRRLTVFHDGAPQRIENSILDLNLGGRRLSTEQSGEIEFAEPTEQRKLLLTVLAVNFSFFAVEMTTGLISGSMGLVADSLDMLADAFVYAISLFAVGASLARKKNIARIAGYFQIALAVVGFVEVIRRFFGAEEMPDFSTMIIVSVLALFANGFCLFLLQKSKSREAHMQASAIFTSNDVIINLGVITAGVLVYLLGSNKPDLIVGTIVFILVIRGAIKILKLGK